MKKLIALFALCVTGSAWALGIGDAGQSGGGGGGGGGSSPPFSDSTALIKNGSDATKLLIISAANVTSGQTRTLSTLDKDYTLGSTSASDLSAGTLPDARLSANVPLIAAANAFTKQQAFAPDSDVDTQSLVANTTSGNFWEAHVAGGTAGDWGYFRGGVLNIAGSRPGARGTLAFASSITHSIFSSSALGLCLFADDAITAASSTTVGPNGGRVVQVNFANNFVLLGKTSQVVMNESDDFNGHIDPATGFGRYAAGVWKATDASTGVRALIGGGTVVASATALPLPSGRVFHVSGTTAITSITSTDFQAGVVITIIFDASLTFTNGNNIKLAGGVNFSATANDAITLAYDGTNWYECCRSVN